MTKNLKLFFFALFFILFLGLGAIFLCRQPTAQNSQLFTANINPPVSKPEINAAAVISVFIDKESKEEILFEKNGDEKLAVASLAKLMTAKIVLENYDLNEVVKISEKTARLPGNGANQLKSGEIFRIIDLLYPALMQSNNTAAQTLAETIGVNRFVELMNLTAQRLEMADTHYLNPTGLDEPDQYSTARDLLKLAKNLLKENPSLWQILSIPEIGLYSSQGEFSYTVTSTNELLGKLPRIVGGKTGETPQAGGCLLLVIEAPQSRGYLINIILNSENRFKEMEKLIHWDEKAHNW